MMPLYHKAFENITRNNNPVLSTISARLIESGGKQIRPLMTLLCAAASGLKTSNDSSHPLYCTAAAIQLLHNSSLIHDDVVDNSSLRRGTPTINDSWGNKVAVLAGDYYLSVVMRTINRINNPQLTETISLIVTEMAQGELLQLQQTGNYHIDEETYLTIIRKKTACFMEASCLAGAIIADADQECRMALKNYGLNIGMAFQISDDILDLLPSQSTGKTQGNDLREHKTTLPVILALKSDDTDNKNKLISLLQIEEPTLNDINTISTILNKLGAIDKARKIKTKYIDKALQSITHLPENQYHNALTELAKKINSDT